MMMMMLLLLLSELICMGSLMRSCKETVSGRQKRMKRKCSLSKGSWAD